MRGLKYRHLACLAFAVALVTGSAMAADPGAPDQQAGEPATAESTVFFQGVQVAIDPTTGRLVAPTAAQRAALSAAMRKRAASAPSRGLSGMPSNEAEALRTLRTHRLRNGRTVVGMKVPESLMVSLVAERRADGSLDIHHAGDSNEAGAVEVTK